MWSTLLSFAVSKLGLTLALVLAAFAAGAILTWRWCHRDEGKTYTESFTVASVANGATITARAGILGRSTRPVYLAGIAAPGLNDPLGPQSRENLAGLAGPTIRVKSKERIGLAKPIAGTCYGSTGADLAVAQLRAGLAKCESQATAAQIAAQKEAQKAKRGLWETSGGSHWWHFGAAADKFPEPIPLEPEAKPMIETVGLALMGLVVLVVLGWIIVYFAGSALNKTAAGKAAVSVVDTTEQIAAYGALTAVRVMPPVAADPEAVKACEYLRTVVTAWPKA